MTNLKPIILFALVAVFAACNKDKENNNPAPATEPKDNVLELAVRTVKPDSLERFKETRTAFINKLKAQEGVVQDAEFQRLFSILGDMDTTTVYVGMTEYQDLATTGTITNAIGASAEAAAFMATFNPRAFTMLRPLDGDSDPNLADLIDENSGQVLEIAVRDTSKYSDMADYKAKRDAFLEKLKAQNGFVAEHQWVSVTGTGTYAVGMTVYKDMAAFQAISGDTTFTKGKEMTDFLGTYPPIYGSLHSPVK